MPVIGMESLTSELLSLLGLASEDPQVEAFLSRMRIYDRPKTVAQLEEEEFIDPDDDETDIEYELAQESKASMVVESPAHGFCLIFKSRSDYSLTHSTVPAGASPFVVQEIGFFDRDVQVYLGYQGSLPGGVRFGMSRKDFALKTLGPPLASRFVYGTLVDLYLINNQIVNFGFRPDHTLAYAHARDRTTFDGIMVSPNLDAQRWPAPSMIGGDLIGRPLADATVQNFLILNGLDPDDIEPGACPEELMQLTKSKGITIYLSNGLLGQQVSSIAYKRRGDLGSQGYAGPMFMGFEFGDSPATLQQKAGSRPIKETMDDQLVSFYWNAYDSLIVQAVCSLIDWQLCRVVLHAKFTSNSVLN